MILLDNHLDQITASAKAISDLEFPPSKIFTNALLGHHEITALIRDTEPHERSLFTVDPNITSNSSSAAPLKPAAFGADGLNRKRTVHQPQQRHGSAVAKVLGNDMIRQIQQSSRGNGRSSGVDIEVLLLGAERLCAFYPVAGAKERISKLRSRYGQISESLSHYEASVIEQQAKLNRLNNSKDYGNCSDEEQMEVQELQTAPILAEIDLRVEEEEIRELEARKKALEYRVAEMEKDLGGLLR